VRKWPGYSLTYLVLFLLAIATSLPFIWMVLTSSRETYSLLEVTRQLVPKTITFENYRRVLQESPFLLWLANSLMVSISAVLTNLIFCSMAGYAFAKMKFFGRSQLFLILIATMMIPRQVTLIPLFALMIKLHLINTYWALILPSGVDVFGIFLMRQFITQIPNELEAAARMDGCTQWQILWRIILPLCKPALSSLAIFIFMWNWNDFVWPLIAVTDADMRTVTVGVSIFEGRYLSNWGIVMAAGVMSVMPLVALFVTLQRYFIQGVAMTGIKG